MEQKSKKKIKKKSSKYQKLVFKTEKKMPVGLKHNF